MARDEIWHHHIINQYFSCLTIGTNETHTSTNHTNIVHMYMIYETVTSCHFIYMVNRIVAGRRYCYPKITHPKEIFMSHVFWHQATTAKAERALIYADQEVCALTVLFCHQCKSRICRAYFTSFHSQPHCCAYCAFFHAPKTQDPP